MPTISLGNVVQQTVEVIQPSFRSTDVFSAGVQASAAAGTVLADTGQVAAGIFDIQIHMSATENVIDQGHIVAHRNAANAADLMVFTVVLGLSGQFNKLMLFGYEMALDERLRVTTRVLGTAARHQSAVIFARRRT